MELFVILAVLAAVGMYWYWQSRRPANCGADHEQGEETDADNGGLGSPLFNQSPDAERNQVANRQEGRLDNQLWVIGPAGPVLMTVMGKDYRERNDGGDSLYLEGGEYFATATWNESYFSETVAARMGTTRGVWCLTEFGAAPAGTGVRAAIRYNTVARRNNRQWFHGTTIYSARDDLFDSALMYYFLFAGFDQPYEYYDELHPVYEDGSDWVDGIETQEQYDGRIVEEEAHATALETARIEAQVAVAAQQEVERVEMLAQQAYEAPERTPVESGWGGSSSDDGGSSSDDGGSSDSGGGSDD